MTDAEAENVLERIQKGGEVFLRSKLGDVAHLELTIYRDSNKEGHFVAYDDTVYAQSSEEEPFLRHFYQGTREEIKRLLQWLDYGDVLAAFVKKRG
ncbi:MAG TPA: hypothetical protein VF017_08190 [Thermoanaerobaculia bacterium]|nr:hypothetical protein [Thermoanaerobaculia bacterium]